MLPGWSSRGTEAVLRGWMVLPPLTQHAQIEQRWREERIWERMTLPGPVVGMMETEDFELPPSAAPFLAPATICAAAYGG